MKMSSQMVERALSQFEAEAVPENHPRILARTRGRIGAGTARKNVAGPLAKLTSSIQRA
jgi:hypothetical protein